MNDYNILKPFNHYIYDVLIDSGSSEILARYLNMLALLLVFTIILLVVDFILRKILLNLINNFALKTKTEFDDFLVKHKTPRNLAHIIPLLIAFELLPVVFVDFPAFESKMELVLRILGVLMVVWIIRSLLQTIRSFSKTINSLKDKPIDSYIQVAMLFVWIIAIAVIFAMLTGIEFIKFFTTLGAASAILLLIFKDTILGFVASIQVAINDTVRIGDWITMEKYGADGDVIEINLAAVKVQNWDKTITTIPTYALISDSFKNWRGMTDSGGRRIKRSVIIKPSSIKFLKPEEVEQLKSIQRITDFLNTRQAEIDTFNIENKRDKSILLNGRNLTNFGVFRQYIATYIEGHPDIKKDMTIMTRQLEPTVYGFPLEIYAFSSDQRWVYYEKIMADIFDHVIAAIPFFGLEVMEINSIEVKK
ncbi:mechanosensitive ion channel [Paucihalobacter ruber]|uniref:Mechanosensing system component YbdG n=1 Tax=Paucihalobacter ruber TaxID=2567861 RepID=A0A506PEI8_9FLAO|nr:mechanosensitive ion channel domain-containing protein [Paucihalobacter ruber]TPV31487.1 mechanosensitive ion channel [Paucihalobacter ruber]